MNELELFNKKKDVILDFINSLLTSSGKPPVDSLNNVALVDKTVFTCWSAMNQFNSMEKIILEHFDKKTLRYYQKHGVKKYVLIVLKRMLNEVGLDLSLQIKTKNKQYSIIVLGCARCQTIDEKMRRCACCQKWYCSKNNCHLDNCLVCDKQICYEHEQTTKCNHCDQRICTKCDTKDVYIVCSYCERQFCMSCDDEFTQCSKWQDNVCYICYVCSSCDECNKAYCRKCDNVKFYSDDYDGLYCEKCVKELNIDVDDSD